MAALIRLLIAGSFCSTPATRRCFSWSHVLVGLGCAAVAAPALAENWRFTPSASITETYTSNANYTASGSSDPDFITSASAALQISGTGARARLNGSIAVTGLFYASETQNNSFAPTVSLTGNLEAIEKFLFVDAQANVTQTFFSPFGPQPGNLVNSTANRYTSQTYSISPYLQGRIGGSNVSYQLRYDNIWTIASQYGNTSADVPNTYFNRLYGALESPAAPWGWTVNYTRSRYKPTDQDIFGTYMIEIGRVIVPYQFNPQLQLSARVGYESERFPLTSSEGVTYGAGGRWAPTDRTLVDGFWEHRFFGASYSLEVSHRLPRTAFSANFSRGLNSYPQNALSIPAGANVGSFVDAAFTTRIPDPAERALAVQQFIAQSGLPPTLASPVNIFAGNILLQDSATVSMVLIGVRNSLAFSFYYLKSESISGKGSVLPPALQFGNNNTQTGGGVSLSHRLSGLTNLTASATYSATTTNATEGPFADARSSNGYLSLGLSTQLGPKTSATAGVSYNRFDPGGTNITTGSSSSVDIYAGISHTF